MKFKKIEFLCVFFNGLEWNSKMDSATMKWYGINRSVANDVHRRSDVLEDVNFKLS